MRKFIFASGTALVLLGVVVGLVSAGPFRQRMFGGSCGPNGCDVAPEPAARSVTWTWKKSELPNGDNRFHLFRGTAFVGFWDARHGYYREYLGNEQWGDKVKQPPHPAPAWAIAKQDDKPDKLPMLEPWQLNGVKTDEIDGLEEPLYTLNGRHVAQQVADDKLLEDDSKKLWLIVNGSGREKVIKDLMADPQSVEFMKRVRVWSVPADHFSLMDRDTKKPMWSNIGNPSICLMGADRVILFEQDGYAGPDDLEAIRKADPTVKPAPAPPKKVDPRKPDGPPSPVPSAPFNPLIPVVALAAGVGLVYFAKRRPS